MMHNQDEPVKSGPGRGFTRRNFLTTVGMGAAGVAVLAKSAHGARPEDNVLPAHTLSRIVLNVNQQEHRLLVEPRWTLLYVLREKLGLTGSKVGCERGECGACTVLIDDLPRYACLTLAVEAEGHRTVTVEGLMEGEDLGSTQQAFVEHDAFQCGYCTSGQIMAVEGLLREIPEPDIDQIRMGVSGNLCRCGAYKHIFEAAGKAARLKGGK